MYEYSFMAPISKHLQNEAISYNKILIQTKTETLEYKPVAQ